MHGVWGFRGVRRFDQKLMIPPRTQHPRSFEKAEVSKRMCTQADGRINMAWIKTVTESAAEGELRSIYDDQRRQAGAVANILQIHSLAPPILKAQLQLYSAVMHAPGDLSRKHREMIAVMVSATNECDY